MWLYQHMADVTEKPRHINGIPYFLPIPRVA